ncbi:MAG: aminotransferase class I/II-fold pyridoxal phosphate-dependent enzyme [Acidimicrobiales bacterium]
MLLSYFAREAGEMSVGLEAHIGDRTSKGIASAVSRLITRGDLAPDDRLPTVRSLAEALGVSPTTVSEAWQTLARAGAIESRGRLGTFVRRGPGPASAPSGRYRRVTEGPGHFTRDLSTGTPDPDLLPDLGPVLLRVGARDLTTSYLDAAVLPALEESLRSSWPFDPDLMTVVDGAMDALDRIASIVVRFGDRVLVENPCFPPLLDLLEHLGTEPIGLDLDEEGIDPTSLANGLAGGPVALFLQPRAHNPTGVSMSGRRARQLARLLKRYPVTIIEDDHAGDISSSPPTSVGAHLPHQTILIRSFSKSHGPDLRLAAIGGAGDIVDRVISRRLLGPGWSSRILQTVLMESLRDQATIDRVGEARMRYAERRHLLSAALGERRVATTGSDGINLWVPVSDERAAQLTLAGYGIGVAPGGPFLVGQSSEDHLRVTVGQVRDGFDELADLLATAASGPTRPHVGPRR